MCPFSNASQSLSRPVFPQLWCWLNEGVRPPAAESNSRFAGVGRDVLAIMRDGGLVQSGYKCARCSLSFTHAVP